MKSVIYYGTVEHERILPVAHQFRYPVYGYGLYLDELQQLDRELLLFGYNRVRPVAIHDKDYLRPDLPGRIREKLLDLLKADVPEGAIDRIFLVTAARYFNYIFNPVSFYYCFDGGQALTAVVAEVNNTFGERHVYIPRKEALPDQPSVQNRYVTDKVFHVSPFNDRKGTYEFFFPTPDQRLSVVINLKKEDRTVFKARLKGTAIPMTGANLLKTLLRKPVTPHLTMPRILWQAARLYLGKKLSYHELPKTDHPMTLIHRH